MRFTKQTTKEIRKWLKDNGFAVGCRIGKEMAFQPLDEDTNCFIVVPKYYDSSLDTYFMNFLKKYGYKGDFDCITLSILHELGHFETEHLFSKEEWESDSVLKEVICFNPCENDKELEEVNYRYWQTPTEFSANLWLIMYVKAFADKVEELENIIDKNYNYEEKPLTKRS